MNKIRQEIIDKNKINIDKIIKEEEERRKLNLKYLILQAKKDLNQYLKII